MKFKYFIASVLCLCSLQGVYAASEGKQKFFIQGDYGRALPFTETVSSSNLLSVALGFVPSPLFAMALNFSTMGSGSEGDVAYTKFSSYGLSGQYRWPMGFFIGADIALFQNKSASLVDPTVILNGSTASVGASGGFEYRFTKNFSLGVEQHVFLVPETVANVNFLMVSILGFVRVWL